MALMGPDGEKHSHLAAFGDAETDRNKLLSPKPHADLPDRGHWVGPGAPNGRDGQPTLLDPPESTARKLTYHPLPGERIADDAAHIIRVLLENQPMIEAQRRVLMQALLVLESFK